MASPEKIAEYVEILAEAYRQTATETTFAAYEFGLTDLSDEQVKRAVATAIRSCKFMPTVKELRELASGMKDIDRPAVAWEALLQVQLNPYSHVDFDDPLINATIRSLGGWPTFIERFDGSEGEKWARKDFMECYSRLLSAGVNGDVCRPLPGLSQCQVVNGQKVEPRIVKIETGLPGLPANIVRPALNLRGIPAGQVPRLKKA